jgi:Xaa-Pro dipeptidase
MKASNRKHKKAVELLRERGLDGLIIFSSGAFHFLRPNLLQYFSEWRPLGPHNAAVISNSGDTVLLVEPEWDVGRASKKSWIKDARGTSNFLDDLTGILREFNISGSIGVAGSSEITADLYQGIEGVAHIILADDIVEAMAKEKTREEVDISRKTGRIADIGFKVFLEHARVGIREYELVGEMEFAMRSAGADDNFTLISSGKHNYAMHPASDKRLAAEDIVIGEISPVCKGQVVQICRTVVLGKANSVLREKYKMLVQALEESKKQIRANNQASSMSIAMNRVISEAGYGKYCYPPYMRARGHGFSLGSIAPGAVIDDDTKANFEKDQVVVVHPNQYLPETGYLACGESVLVTENGFERLVGTETKLYSKEG